MLEVDQVIWNSMKKRKARHETIIFRYRSIFGRHSLPLRQQMYSMCGQCASKGKQIRGCEPDQILQSQLIQPQQYHGIENNPDIHALNVQAWTNLNWYNGDFCQVMSGLAVKGEFVPGIVNCDLTQTPDTAAPLVAKVIQLVSQVAKQEEVLLIANFVLRARNYKKKDGDHIVRKLEEMPVFMHAWNSANWQMLDEYCQYAGTNSGNRTWMGGLIFALNAPAFNEG